MAVIEVQSESGIEGRMIEERRRVGLSVVLDAVEIVRAVGVVVGSEVGRVGLEPGTGTGIKRTGVVVAIELESLWVGLTGAAHCEIVAASGL